MGKIKDEPWRRQHNQYPTFAMGREVVMNSVGLRVNGFGRLGLTSSDVGRGRIVGFGEGDGELVVRWYKTDLVVAVSVYHVDPCEGEEV